MPQCKEAIRVDAVLCAFDIWANRMTASSNQDMINGNELAIDLYGIGINKLGKAFDDFYAVFG